MTDLDVSGLVGDGRPTGVWAAALLHALAREERAGRRPPRLTEPDLATWNAFRGRLEAADLVALLFEDEAVLHPIPFAPDALAPGGTPAPVAFSRLADPRAQAWLEALRTLDLDAPPDAYVLQQARRLGLPTTLARSHLHVVRSHQKVLELPGTGGQLAHHLVSTNPELTLQENFAIACDSWQQLALAGIVALDLGAPHSDFIAPVTVDDLRRAEHPLRQRTFDFVIGLHPDKGGLFREQDQLALWFPTARILLV